MPGGLPQRRSRQDVQFTKRDQHRVLSRAPTATTITTGEFRGHFKEVSAHQFERNPEELEVTIGNVKDLRGTALAREKNFIMNEEPTEGEIWKAIAEINDSAPGEDGVRNSYIRQGGTKLRRKLPV